MEKEEKEEKEEKASIEKEIFINYVRTLQIFTLRYRTSQENWGVEDYEINKPVHIPTADIERRFFPTDRKNKIAELESAGKLIVDRSTKAYTYAVTQAGHYDLSLIEIKPIPANIVYQKMMETLCKVSLKQGADTTPYFDLFMCHKAQRTALFFRVDVFAGRVHTPVSNFHRHLRPNILIDGQPTTSLDVATMQPLLLGKILSQHLPNNEYSQWINEGKDIYLMLQEKAGLKDRDSAKKKFFEILFSKPSNALSKLFGKVDWIDWINHYKSLKIVENPHNEDKPHSNLAWMLQSTEVKVMMQVWGELTAMKIPFLSVHDELIIKETDCANARQVLERVLSKEFIYFKVDGKANLEPTTPPPAPEPVRPTKPSNTAEWDDLFGWVEPSDYTPPQVPQVNSWVYSLDNKQLLKPFASGAMYGRADFASRLTSQLNKQHRSETESLLKHLVYFGTLKQVGNFIYKP